MNQKETLKLWKQGKEAWNAWAEKMLADRKALEDKGDWDVTAFHFVEENPANEITEQWFTDARAVFSSKESPHIFPEETSFEGWLFPSVSEWSAATFEEDTHFDKATFKSCAQFDKVTFESFGQFNNVSFEGNTQFNNVTFEGFAGFEDATFDGHTQFNNAIFASSAGFDDATFKSDAHFNSVCFEKPTRFSGSQFNANTTFNSAQIKQAFDLSGARFKEVPDFRQTHCEEAPLLDDVHISSTIINQRKPSQEPDFTVTANYRALKRLAIQGHDHKHEVEFFAEELKSRRLMVYTPSNPNWWLSSLFDELSDYGRSIVRPLMYWIVLVMLSAVHYIAMATPLDVKRTDECLAGAGSQVNTAYQLAFAKGLLVPGLADRTIVTQAYDCLFGGIIPGSATVVAGIQTLPAVLLFLLLLGIRNRFKLK